ncbi:MAG: hypothetical protein M3O87_06595, partial [Candidatus Dormibacteraeota bacterium]|nr:hypothetical protein [Candidatus Dormibacteraeota bacterium]
QPPGRPQPRRRPGHLLARHLVLPPRVRQLMDRGRPRRQPGAKALAASWLSSSITERLWSPWPWSRC